MVKKFLTLLCVVLLAMVFCTSAFAASYVEDAQGVFNEQQRVQIEKTAASVYDQHAYVVQTILADAVANPPEYVENHAKKHPEIKNGLFILFYSMPTDGRQKYYLHPISSEKELISKAELEKMAKTAEARYKENPQVGIYAFTSSMLASVEQTLNGKKNVSQSKPQNPVGEKKGTYLHDRLNLFDATGATELESELSRLSQTFKVNVVVLTSADLEGSKDAQTMADRYILNNVNESLRENIILLFLYLNGEDRSVGVSTKGEGILYMTDRRVNGLLDAMMPDLKQGNYTDAIVKGIDQIEENLKEGIPPGKEKKPKGLTPFESLLGFLPAGLGAFFVRRRIRTNYSEKAASDPYDTSRYFRPAYHKNQRRLVDQVISYEARSNSNQSTTHKTDGQDFGGGSRKF